MTVYYPTISPAEFEKAMARACVRAITKAERYEPLRGGDQTAVQYGPLIREIADEADLSVPQTRRRLQALQLAGKVIRDDRRGGTTAWWLVGLADAQRPVAPAAVAAVAPPVRQALTAPVAARQHWSDVLGVPFDCSTSEARAAFRSAVAALDQADPDYPNQSRRVRDAIDACCRDHEIQIEE
ncbi:MULTISPECIES: FaeA/PapI family transcriptional regulator [Luteibacter]|uniref:FaeA/PapI family transcriptional regulator n=1 Tax=Luteibacter TaxID=242605 RepID=UPI00055EE62B|nr:MULTISPECIES: FaeA/PapI family transcriptional regulator [unclassified Luteibacter]